MSSLLLQLLVLLALLALGYWFGNRAEQRHLKSLQQRETLLKRLPVFPEKVLPAFRNPPETLLVSGNVVIAADYFKRFAANIISLFGGRIGYYDMLLQRARREALLRMREAAARYGAQAVFNVKLETVSIAKTTSNSIGSIEVLAYGTAIIPPKNTQTNWNTGRFKQPLDIPQK